MSDASESPERVPWQVPSWDAIVRANGARVYGLAYRLTGNVHDAEDLTQETFVRVFRSMASYQPGSFDGWIHRITVNLFLDMVRRSSRLHIAPLGEEAARLSDRMASPERQFEFRNLDTDVQDALDCLTPEFRVAVVLCDIEGFTYEEIAGTLGVKIGTVRSRIHRARTQLRLSLAHRAPELGRSLVGSAS
ncbi:MAG: RNA polymerase sigma factor SigE [Bifidobacteriaceae bacterium]|nr:RNA polymerase sigma factor SigE [Bifidobacteriaceae bacterium]